MWCCQYTRAGRLFEDLPVWVWHFHTRAGRLFADLPVCLLDFSYAGKWAFQAPARVPFWLFDGGQGSFSRTCPCVTWPFRTRADALFGLLPVCLLDFSYAGKGAFQAPARVSFELFVRGQRDFSRACPHIFCSCQGNSFFWPLPWFKPPPTYHILLTKVKKILA